MPFIPRKVIPRHVISLDLFVVGGAQAKPGSQSSLITMYVSSLVPALLLPFLYPILAFMLSISSLFICDFLSFHLHVHVHQLCVYIVHLLVMPLI